MFKTFSLHDQHIDTIGKGSSRRSGVIRPKIRGDECSTLYGDCLSSSAQSNVVGERLGRRTNNCLDVNSSGGEAEDDVGIMYSNWWGQVVRDTTENYLEFTSRGGDESLGVAAAHEIVRCDVLTIVSVERGVPLIGQVNDVHYDGRLDMWRLVKAIVISHSIRIGETRYIIQIRWAQRVIGGLEDTVLGDVTQWMRGVSHIHDARVDWVKVTIGGGFFEQSFEITLDIEETVESYSMKLVSDRKLLNFVWVWLLGCLRVWDTPYNRTIRSASSSRGSKGRTITQCGTAAARHAVYYRLEERVCVGLVRSNSREWWWMIMRVDTEVFTSEKRGGEACVIERFRQRAFFVLVSCGLGCFGTRGIVVYSEVLGDMNVFSSWEYGLRDLGGRIQASVVTEKGVCQELFEGTLRRSMDQHDSRSCERRWWQDSRMRTTGVGVAFSGSVTGALKLGWRCVLCEVQINFEECVILLVAHLVSVDERRTAEAGEVDSDTIVTRYLIRGVRESSMSAQPYSHQKYCDTTLRHIDAQKARQISLSRRRDIV
ncbi:hypothetical protein Tco_0857244 [Tanacetum coccineum]|uniref:Uncharacterized protein n=1 Tax=Tanacetum coccineum TaxID=301880 RepID=A0ABQ5B7T4_9ASTR